MATNYTLKPGYTLTVTAGAKKATVHQVEDSSIGAVLPPTFSRTYGPYLAERNFTVSDDATVSVAVAAAGATFLTNAGAPASAVRASGNVNPTGDDNGLTFTAREYGTGGNSIRVTYVDPGAATQALAVSVAALSIVVSLETDGDSLIVSTAADVKAAIEAHEEANRLVSVAIMTSDSGSADDGTGVVTAMAATALTGGTGTGIGNALPGCVCVDTTNGYIYVNDGTAAAPVWVRVVTGTDVPVTVDIALAASATTDGMDITFTVQDAHGATIAAVFVLDWWISEDAQGEGLTADSYSGDVTTGTGTELHEFVSKKHYRGLTTVNGVMVATAVASTNPTDQYVAVRHPVTGKVIVSGASGTNWEGAA